MYCDVIFTGVCLCVYVCVIMHSWVSKQVCLQLPVEPQTSTSAIFLALYIKNSITYIYLEIRVLQMSHKTCGGQRQLAEVSFLLYYAGPRDGRLGDKHLLRHLVSTLLRQGMSPNQKLTNSA